MKKLLLLALATILFAACENKNSYTVTGTIEGGENGDMVYLQKDLQSNNLLDSAKIENGKFVFKGEQETPEITYIIAPKQNLQLNFVLENGNIELTVTNSDEKDVRKGTKNNDNLQNVLTKISAAGTNVDNIIMPAMSEDLSEEQIAETKKNIFPAIEEYNKIFEECTQNSENDVVAKYIATSRRKINLTEESFDNMIKSRAEQRKATAKTAVGMQFVDVSGNNIDGNAVKLSAYAGKGKYVLVDFWASWCKPCIGEIPNLKKLYEKYNAQGFEIVSISLDRKNEDWKQALEEHNMPWQHFVDANGEASSTYGVNSIPHMMILDKDGKIIARDVRGKSLEEKLKEIFGN